MRHSLIGAYRQMHSQQPLQGRAIYAQLDRLIPLIKTTGAKTLLDYGCGQGRQYFEGRVHELWGGLMPTLYDPAVPEHEQRPTGQFDGLIVTDVMEHIPEDEVIETLEDIRSLAGMWAFFSICCLPANKTFPGTATNVHVTIQPPDWWRWLIAAVFAADEPRAHVEFITKRGKKHAKPSSMQKNPERYTYHKQRNRAVR